MSEELDVGFLDVQAWKTRPEDREANCERHHFQFHQILFIFFTLCVCLRLEIERLFLAGNQ